LLTLNFNSHEKRGAYTTSSDKSLFYDSFHPNAKGRKVFSREIKTALDNLHLVH
jgi:lysophospholipase L1-like esterase